MSNLCVITCALSIEFELMLQTVKRAQTHIIQLNLLNGWKRTRHCNADGSDMWILMLGAMEKLIVFLNRKYVFVVCSVAVCLALATINMYSNPIDRRSFLCFDTNSSNHFKIVTFLYSLVHSFVSDSFWLYTTSILIEIPTWNGSAQVHVCEFICY